MDKKVDVYIARQKSPQKEICQRIRKIILKTLPGIQEEFKMGVAWYEGKYYIVGLKDHVNLGFSLVGLSRQEKALFEGKGKTMKHISFSSLKDVDEVKIVKLLELIASKHRR